MRIVFKLRELLVATKLRWSGRIVLNHTSEMTMRMMLKFTLPVEKGNQAIKDGSLGKTLESDIEPTQTGGRLLRAIGWQAQWNDIF